MELGSQLQEPRILRYAARFEFTYDGVLVYMVTPYLNHPPFIRGSSYPCILAPD
jgi:hypothetical protein